ncbi:MAG: methionyl-tRNA formyltransferase [Gammaproteobacteria bacterium]
MSTAKPRLAFAGTPALAAQILRHLINTDKVAVTEVYTQPDKPAGRGRKLQASAVKQVAAEYGLPIKQPSSAAELAQDESLAAADVLVVVAYGMILPTAVLDRPKAGCINIHTSLLPRWRGAAPVQRAIQAGDTQTGISIMQMDDGIDTGAILLQKTCPIESADTTADLHERLALLGGECISETLELLQQDRLRPEPQAEDGASYAAKISKAEAQINWDAPAQIINNMIRAFNPAPVAFTELQDKTIRVWQATPLAADNGTASGRIKDYTRQGLDVACADGLLRITRLQLQGKQPQAIEDFYNGHPDMFHG